LLDFAERFREFKPPIILAYANSLATMVDFYLEKGIELPSPQAIITSAEVLTDENRAIIEKYFHAPIFDRYGARETSVIASECSAHDGMHICAEYLHLEFLKDGCDAEIGEEGEIIVTKLSNLAFPFIRYQIGDVGSPAASGCSCGVTLPKMKMVAGRTTDFLLAPDGRRVSGAALTIYLAAKVQGIRQAQIVQRELGKLTFNLVLGSEFNDDSRRHLRERVNHFFGPNMEIEINSVDEIPREASGKYRFSICQVASVR
jgi:phenylacetate-CoA ligase